MLVFLYGLLAIMLVVVTDYVTWRLLKRYQLDILTLLKIICLCSLGCLLAFLGAYIFFPLSEHSLKWGLFIFLLLYIPRIIFLLYWLIGILPLFWLKSLRKVSIYAGLTISLLVFFLILYGGLIGRTKLTVQTINIRIDKLPKSFNGFKIVQFSDLHLGSLENDLDFVVKIVERINSLNPDIVVFTGDLVNDRSEEIAPFKEILSGIKADVYSVMGNHDYGDYIPWKTLQEKEDNLARIKEIQQSMRWTLLDNENHMIYNGNDHIALAGVGNRGEPPYKQYSDLKAATRNITNETVTVLLSHNPMHWRDEVLPATDIALTLSGHTHAMQVRFGKLSPAIFRYRHWAGLYHEENQYMYVNQGIGYVSFPLRIGAYPEITLIILETSAASEILDTVR